MRSWEDANLGGGRFNQQDMLALIEELLTAGKQQGLRTDEAVGQHGVGVRGPSGRPRYCRYETRLNYLLPNYNDVVVCTYDVTKFSASVVMDVMRTHNQVIVGGVL